MPSFTPRRVSALLGGAVFALALLGGAPMGGLAVVSSAHAQQAGSPTPAQVALAKQLVEANGEARAFEGVVGNIVDGAALSFLQANPDLVQHLREVAQALRPEFEKRRSEILDILAEIYARRFTEAELKEALVFYTSPTGKKMVTDRPIIVQDAIQRIRVWGDELNGEAVERVRAEMRKKGFDI